MMTNITQVSMTLLKEPLICEVKEIGFNFIPYTCILSNIFLGGIKIVNIYLRYV